LAPLRIFLLDLLPTVPYYAAALALALKQAGASVTFGLTTYWLDKDHFRARGLEPAPGLVDIAALLPARPAWLRRLLKLAEALANLLILAVCWTFRPQEIVHVQFLSLWLRGMPFELWLLTWARRRGSRLVYTVHDLLPHDTGRRHFTRYARLYSHFDALICHSESVRSRLHEEFSIPLERIWVLPHGPLFRGPEIADSSLALTRLGCAPGTELVLWQGIIHPYKGVLFLLDAWAQVAAQRPHARLLIAGIPAAVAPDHAVEITNRIAQLGLAESVRTDYRYLPEEELQACYAAAAAVVYPYREISTSGALMTGLGQGKAVIATRLPAFAEILTNGENALLVDFGDADALAAAILRLLDDAALRHRLEQAARAEADRRGWESIALRTLDHYRSLRGAPS
jgi:glycosyltransferase involved in cell wall biosynthesis